ncbi:MAG TPA: heavy-metal-associated domain-containing protein [Flavobacteriales bacterium]|nr:heavy-metal-associated domain-containing protein [Flavobacteriales bacterium]
MNITSILATLAIGFFISANASGQGTTSTTKPGLESVKIQSSAICDMCEKTIETEMIYEKGVKKVDVDLSTAAVLVDFDPKKTDATKLRSALVKLGYSADGTPGNPEAFAKLPLCCQNEGCGKLPEKP